MLLSLHSLIEYRSLVKVNFMLGLSAAQVESLLIEANLVEIQEEAGLFLVAWLSRGCICLLNECVLKIMTL